jgi:hypothetical protein
LQILLAPVQGTIYSRSLTAFLPRSTDQTLIKLLLVLPTNPILYYVLSTTFPFLYGFVDWSTIVERIVNFGFTAEFGFLGLSVDVVQNSVILIQAPILLIVILLPRFLLRDLLAVALCTLSEEVIKYHIFASIFAAIGL